MLRVLAAIVGTIIKTFTLVFNTPRPSGWTANIFVSRESGVIMVIWQRNWNKELTTNDHWSQDEVTLVIEDLTEVVSADQTDGDQPVNIDWSISERRRYNRELLEEAVHVSLSIIRTRASGDLHSWLARGKWFLCENCLRESINWMSWGVHVH